MTEKLIGVLKATVCGPSDGSLTRLLCGLTAQTSSGVGGQSLYRFSRPRGVTAGERSTPIDIEELQRTITRLEQRNLELTETLEESQADLAAAGEANRELTRTLNQRGEQAGPRQARP
ncbi:hypothetical protein [Streptomyces geranii]|uniref:hypothetical protein n=1 Tax=Streptomyces geranii TaxID=2058923 RepID=UPI001E35642F|nr:hypothetical protein [Streptomyces geranii]